MSIAERAKRAREIKNNNYCCEGCMDCSLSPYCRTFIFREVFWKFIDGFCKED